MLGPDELDELSTTARTTALTTNNTTDTASDERQKKRKAKKDKSSKKKKKKSKKSKSDRHSRTDGSSQEEREDGDRPTETDETQDDDSEVETMNTRRKRARTEESVTESMEVEREQEQVQEYQQQNDQVQFLQQFVQAVAQLNQQNQHQEHVEEEQEEEEEEEEEEQEQQDQEQEEVAAEANHDDDDDEVPNTAVNFDFAQFNAAFPFAYFQQFPQLAEHLTNLRDAAAGIVMAQGMDLGENNDVAVNEDQGEEEEEEGTMQTPTKSTTPVKIRENRQFVKTNYAQPPPEQNPVVKQQQKAPVVQNKAWVLSNMSKTKNGEADNTDTSKLKSGRFSSAEKDVLRNAVQRFLQMHNLSEDDLPALLKRRKNAQGSSSSTSSSSTSTISSEVGKTFWKEVAGSLPDRTIESVYHCVRRLYDDRNVAQKFTPEDDQMLLQLVTIHGKKWEKIGETMGRMGEAIKNRHTYLMATEEFSKGKWKAEDVEALKTSVLEMKRVKKYDSVDQVNNWSEIAPKVGRSAKDCAQKWHDSVRSIVIREGESDVQNATKWNKDYSIMLLEGMLKLEAVDESDVDWKALSVGPLKVYSRRYLVERWISLRSAMGETEGKTFKECVQMCLNLVKSGKTTSWGRPCKPPSTEKKKKRRSSEAATSQSSSSFATPPSKAYLSADFVNTEDEEED